MPFTMIVDLVLFVAGDNGFVNAACKASHGRASLLLLAWGTQLVQQGDTIRAEFNFWFKGESLYHDGRRVVLAHVLQDARTSTREHLFVSGYVLIFGAKFLEEHLASYAESTRSNFEVEECVGRHKVVSGLLVCGVYQSAGLVIPC